MKFTSAILSILFPTCLKSHDENLNILRTERTFSIKSKSIFIIFKGLSAARNCLRTKSRPSLSNYWMSLTHYSPVLLFYTPWKHQKTFRFPDVFRGYTKATPGCNGLNKRRWIIKKDQFELSQIIKQMY